MPKIRNFNVYYGLLHAHSNISDGKGSPDKAYCFAKEEAGLDFFALADHNNGYHGMWGAGWPEYALNDIVQAAHKYYAPGWFVTLAGFEMTTRQTGHIAVVYNPDMCLNMDENYFFNPIDAGVETLDEFYRWLDTQPAVGFFNHPGESFEHEWDAWHPAAGWGPEFKFFEPTVYTDRMVGIELFNGNSGFSTYYYECCWKNVLDKLAGSEYTLKADTFYDEALQKGWRVGAAGSDDNHSMTWGKMNDYRLAVLAKELTRDEIFRALEARRFYSTMDKNLVLSFTVAGQEMGSTVQAGVHDLVVEAFNTAGERIKSVALVKNGKQAAVWDLGEKYAKTSQLTAAAAGDYFYVIVAQMNGLEAISSPIWVE